MKELNYTSLFNGRDIGGMLTKDNHHIKKGRLFRSGCLYPINENDKKILESLHLTDVVDFRESGALLLKPDYQIPGVNYHHFSPVNFTFTKANEFDEELIQKVINLGGGHNFMVRLYSKMFSTPQAIESYTNFFKVLIEKENRVVLWHCAQGKDRAGMASFLLEYALGVSYEDCLKDYLYSKIAMDKYINMTLPAVKEHFNNDEQVILAFKDSFTVKEDYLKAALNYITTTYQSIDNFLINVLKVDVPSLRKIYLE